LLRGRLGNQEAVARTAMIASGPVAAPAQLTVNPSGAKRGCGAYGIVCTVSAIPAAPDVLAPDVEVLPLPDVAERLGQPITRVHQLIREGQVVAVRRDGVLGIPAPFLTDAGVRSEEHTSELQSR